MAEAAASAGDLPLLLTRVGLERAEVAETVVGVRRGRARRRTHGSTSSTCSKGHHGFDNQDDTEEARAAIRTAMTWVEQAGCVTRTDASGV
ncbi:MAG: hypothetical protein WKF76_05905 [Nocardioidaceae bacterium]